MTANVNIYLSGAVAAGTLANRRRRAADFLRVPDLLPWLQKPRSKPSLKPCFKPNVSIVFSIDIKLWFKTLV